MEHLKQHCYTSEFLKKQESLSKIIQLLQKILHTHYREYMRFDEGTHVEKNSKDHISHFDKHGISFTRLVLLF